MEGFLGGYILIPTQIIHQAVDILEQALPASWADNVGKMTAHFDAGGRELDPQARKESFAVIREAGWGTIILNLYRISVFIHAEKSLDDYAVFSIYFEEVPLLNLKQDQLEDFVKMWTQFCQRVQANFGYFGRFFYVAEEEYRDTAFLPALRSQDFAQLGYEFIDCWLQYYSPQFLQNNPGRQTLEQSLTDVIQDFEYKAATLTNLDNGGVLFRSGSQPLDTGDKDE